MNKQWFLSSIPKIAHFYFGGRQVDYLRYLTIVTFRKLNPDWEIRFYYPKYPQSKISWTTFEQKYPFVGDDYFNKIKELPITFVEIDMAIWGLSNKLSEVHKSDFLRLYLLSTYGGLWSDMDILYIKPIAEVNFNIQFNEKIDTCICISSYGHSIGFMLSSPKNDLFLRLWQLAKKEFNSGGYQSIGTILYTKEFPTIQIAHKKCSMLNIINIPMETVYPYNATMIDKIYKDNDSTYILANTIGLHWYAGHPLAGEFLTNTCGGILNLPDNILSQTIINCKSDTVTEAINTICTGLDKILDVGCGIKDSLTYLTSNHITTLDIWKPFKPDKLWDLNNTPLPFKDNEFDISICLDVIEHLDKEKGMSLLKELKRISKKYIVILTPLWWTENKDQLDNPNSPFYKNPYNLHKSLWKLNDFLNWKLFKHNKNTLDNYFFGYWTKPLEAIQIKSNKERKIFVTGVYDSGKTTFAKAYAEKEQLTLIEFDTIFKYENIDKGEDLEVLNKLPNEFIIDAIPFSNHGISNFMDYCKKNQVKVICTVCTDRKIIKQRMKKGNIFTRYFDKAYFYYKHLKSLEAIDIIFYDTFKNEYITKEEVYKRLKWLEPLKEFLD